MGNNRLSVKHVGSQASRRVTRRLAWIQPVCKSINAVPALKGLNYKITISPPNPVWPLNKIALKRQFLQLVKHTIW